MILNPQQYTMTGLRRVPSACPLTIRFSGQCVKERQTTFGNARCVDAVNTPDQVGKKNLTYFAANETTWALITEKLHPTRRVELRRIEPGLLDARTVTDSWVCSRFGPRAQCGRVRTALSAPVEK